MFTYTADQLKDWKKKYGDGNLFEAVVEDKKAVLHKPSRKDLSFSRAASSQGTKIYCARMGSRWIR